MEISEHKKKVGVCSRAVRKEVSFLVPVFPRNVYEIFHSTQSEQLFRPQSWSFACRTRWSIEVREGVHGRVVFVRTAQDWKSGDGRKAACLFSSASTVKVHAASQWHQNVLGSYQELQQTFESGINGWAGMFTRSGLRLTLEVKDYRSLFRLFILLLGLSDRSTE